jgi:hypothetical protein
MKAIQKQHQSINIPSRALSTWSEVLGVSNFMGFSYNKQENTVIGIDYNGV